jgi:hypothetical protein
MPYIRDIKKTNPELFKPRHFSSNEQTLELVTGDNDRVNSAWQYFRSDPGEDKGFTGTRIRSIRTLAGVHLEWQERLMSSFATMSATNHRLTSARGRVGFIGWSKTLCYVTGGAAWASTEYNGHMTHYQR